MSYRIKIERGETEGQLTFTGGGAVPTIKCYWNPNKKIPAGTYNGCSATTMANKTNSKGKKREAVFIPNVTGFTGIFLHMGRPPYSAWSDGCIVMDEDKLLKIYDAINPKDGRNVTIEILDV